MNDIGIGQKKRARVDNNVYNIIMALVFYKKKKKKNNQCPITTMNGGGFFGVKKRIR